MPRVSWDLSVGLRRERVIHAATALLVIRVLDGLAAWLLFNEFFLGTAPVEFWVVPVAFVTYLTLNLVVTLYYRAGRASMPLFVLDVAVNVVPLMWPLAASGGLASPLLLLFPVKAIIYVMVFNARIAWLSLLATGVMLTAMVGLGRANILPLVRLYEVPPVTVYGAVRVALLCLLIIGPLAIAWLRYVVTAAERRPVLPPRLPNRLDSDAASTAVANALLTVSETVSRLTRLEEIFEKVVEIAPQSLLVDDCVIALWSEDSGTYREVAAAGSAPSEDQHFPGPPLTPEAVKDFEWVRRLGRCGVVRVSRDSDEPGADGPVLLIAPLISGEHFYGVMRFARQSPGRPFTQRDLTLADGIARQTAVALERARLIEESRRLARAVESTQEAVVITDAQRRVIFANEAFLRTFGYERDEVIGHDAIELSGSSEDWMADTRREARRHGWRAEVTAHRKDGTPIPLVVNTSLIRDDDGRIQGAVAIVEDVSAQRVLQEQLQRADRLAAVGEMAAGIAHEVNNALTAIFGQIEGAEDLGEAQLRSALKHVDRQARRIAEIVQGVVGFARPRPLRLEPVDLAGVTAETLDLLRHDLQSVRLDTQYDPDLPPATADRQQVQQVLLNLFHNALQALNARQSARLSVSVFGVDDRLAVRVTDNGPGIPPAVLPRIFDPFFSTKPEGTGLGLSVSYAIAHAHGGDLRVESEVDHGTTFTLLLPIAARQERGAGQSALLVDDDPDVAQALADMLEKEGFLVDRVSTGRDALQQLQAGFWEVVFLDVRLPDLSGPEVYAELSHLRPELARRVVFVTGGVWRSESRLRQQLPAQPILAKPCTQDELREVLRLIRSRAQEAA